jgi:hypothetical protein
MKMVIDAQQRQPPLGGPMTFQEYLALELRSVDIAISMDEIYQGINFAEFLTEE